MELTLNESGEQEKSSLKINNRYRPLQESEMVSKERLECLEKIRKDLRSRHWCGSQGFGLHWSDVCPACESSKRKISDGNSSSR